MKDPITGKQTLGKQGFSILFAAVTALVSFALALALGPMHLSSTVTGETLVIPAWYMASAGFPFGILMAEAVIDFREYRHWARRLAPTVMLLLLGLLGSIPWGGSHPASGHALIATFFLLHELSGRREGRTWKLLLGCAVLLVTAGVKLLAWGDAATLLVGVGLGACAWGIEQLYALYVAVRLDTGRKPAPKPEAK
jgi:hypothetical protein